MEFRHIRYFIAVAEELNFTRAAVRLSTAQPSLSQQIRQLEEEIGTALFQRTQRHVILTPAGQALLREAREIQRRVERLAEIASGAASGKSSALSVGVNSLAEVRVIPKVVPFIERRFPDLIVTYHSVSSSEQIAGLRDYSLDMGFMWGPLSEPTLFSEEVLKERIVVALPANHSLATKRRISLEMLVEYPWIGISDSMPAQVRDPLVALYCRTRNRTHWVHEANSISGAMNMVAMGLGYAFIPEFAVAAASQHVVTRPLLVDPVPSFSLVAVSRAGDDLPGLAVIRTVMSECLRSPASNGLERHP
jgi:LysR family hca operon transcriptional activator